MSIKRCNSSGARREAIGAGRKAPSGIERARKAFRRAFERLYRRARKNAEEQLASAVKDINKADQTIAEIASQLPRSLRQRIAEKRRELSARTVKPRSVICLSPRCCDLKGKKRVMSRRPPLQKQAQTERRLGEDR